MNNDNSFTTLCPSTDWYYVFKDNDRPAESTVFPVAVWALNKAGDVVGLISTSSTTNSNVPRLVPPPPIGGRYLHKTQLDAELLSRAKLG